MDTLLLSQACWPRLGRYCLLCIGSENFNLSEAASDESLSVSAP